MLMSGCWQRLVLRWEARQGTARLARGSCSCRRAVKRQDRGAAVIPGPLPTAGGDIHQARCQHAAGGAVQVGQHALHPGMARAGWHAAAAPGLPVMLWEALCQVCCMPNFLLPAPHPLHHTRAVRTHTHILHPASTTSHPQPNFSPPPPPPPPPLPASARRRASVASPSSPTAPT